ALHSITSFPFWPLPRNDSHVSNDLSIDTTARTNPAVFRRRAGDRDLSRRGSYCDWMRLTSCDYSIDMDVSALAKPGRKLFIRDMLSMRRQWVRNGFQKHNRRYSA